MEPLKAEAPPTIELIARATGHPVGLIGHYARRLRETDRDLWPAIKAGRRTGGTEVKGAVDPAHMVLLLLAVATTVKPIDGPKAAPLYAGLSVWWNVDPSGKRSPLDMGGITLGQFMRTRSSSRRRCWLARR